MYFIVTWHIGSVEFELNVIDCLMRELSAKLDICILARPKKSFVAELKYSTHIVNMRADFCVNSGSSSMSCSFRAL